MADINIQEDLSAVNDQITKMMEELNRLSTARDQMIQQLQNMHGVAMYLRGKLTPEEQSEQVAKDIVEESAKGEDSESEDNITRTVEYP